jgi:diguanylate cyclase (GGDEF)-like protein
MPSRPPDPPATGAKASPLGGGRWRFALVIEPNRQAAAELANLLFSQRVECAVAHSGDHAWHALATRTPDLILLSIGAPALDGFHRRLRDEYLGPRPTVYAIGDPESLGPEVSGFEPDAVLLRPLPSAELLAAPLPVHDLDRVRLREMLRLSALGGELEAQLDSIAHRLALVYGVSRCAVLTVARDSQDGGLGEPGSDEKQPDLWRRCAQAVRAGAPLYAPRDPAASDSPAGALETRLAVPIPAAGGATLGAICLLHDRPVRFSDGARDALANLAARLGVELSWRSVHDRVSAERDHLRETAVIDPTVGVLSRGALEQAMAAEIARLEGGAPLAVAVIDIVGLRLINDRYGHLAGDAALVHLAGVTRRLLRPHDILGRSGGDEIAVVLAQTQTPAATALCDRIRCLVETEPLASDSGPIHLRVGIGVAEYGPADPDPAALLERAGRSAAVASQRGGAIAIADRASPREETKRNLSFDRYQPGVTLGGMYQIVHEISRGAMGVVYRAEDLGLSRPVALKMLRSDQLRDPELVRRFRAEASVLASIDHENLVRVYTFVEERDTVFFVMELVEGVSLDNHIAEKRDEGRFIDQQRTCAILSQVASALDAMHRAGVMHRDVKPGNVVLDRTRDRAVLVDVGLAVRVGDRSEPAGTPGYIAPESFRGGPEGAATDVYGLAATAYAMLTARPPFGQADDYREILLRQLDDRPTPPSAWRANLPPAVDAVLLRGLAVAMEARFASAGDLARALEDALGGDLAAETEPAAGPEMS